MGGSAYEDGTECTETLAYKIQTPGHYPEESVQYLGFFFLGPEYIKSLILGAIWNFSKETGLHELVSDFGAQMTCF
jgi:hypothetical protein